MVNIQLEGIHQGLYIHGGITVWVETSGPPFMSSIFD